MRRFASASVVILVLVPSASLGAAEEPMVSPSPSIVAAAPTANVERPLTHEELLYVRDELRDRSFRSTTLVADTLVLRDQAVRSIDEPRPYRHGIGVLPRGPGSPGDPVVQGSRQVRGLYSGEDSPIEGRLAFDLDVEGIQLLGTVALPAGTYLTPIEPAALSAAAALPSGALIVAHGWLSKLGAEATCPDLPESRDPHDNGGWGDSFVRCPGGWLTAEEVAAPDPSDPLTPESPGVPVQWGAQERFNREMDVERPATYLLRRVANPVEGAEPALGWEVIARLDAIETETVAVATELSAADRPGGLDWQPVIERQAAADTWVISSTPWAKGFASIHVGRDRVLSSWFSPDGRSWKHASLPVGITFVSTLLPLRDGLAIIADEDRFGRSWTFEVWTSSDGLTWREASRQRIPTTRRYADYRRIVHGYWPTDEGIVALQTYTQQPCCGSGPGSTFLAAATETRDVTLAWTSRDGRRWRQQRARGVHSYPGTHLGSSISASDGELLALWPEESRRIARSTDGIRWRTISRYPADLDIDAPFTLARTDDGLMLAGEPWGTDISTGNALTVWRKPADGAWVRTLEPRQGTPKSIAAVGQTVIIAGDRLDPEQLDTDDPPSLPWLLVSTDGGRTWDESLGWFGDSPWCLKDLTERDGSVLLDAGCAPSDAATGYLATAG